MFFPRNPHILSSRAENLKLGSTGSNASSSTSSATSNNKLDPKYFHNPQLNTNPLRSTSGGFDLQKKLSPTHLPVQLGTNNPLVKTVPATTANAALVTGVAAKPNDKATPSLASSYFPH